MWKYLPIFATFLLLDARVEATSVILSDGSVLKGEIVSESRDSIALKTLFGTVRLSRADILSKDATPRNLSPEPEKPALPAVTLQSSYGEREDAAATQLIADTWGEAAADAYRGMNGAQKAQFLDTAWQKKSRLFHRYYYGYHLGKRHYTVSPAFFERGGTIPRRYATGFSSSHPDDIATAAGYVKQILRHSPDDPVALCALGYLRLEDDKVDEAKDLFIKAIRKERQLVEARNGRALAYMKMHHQKARALTLFRETVAMDRTYVGALYAMGMCHIAMMGNDRVGLDEYFGRVIEADPRHPDAYYKLGAFNEALRRMDRAAESYSRQLSVNPAHKRASERLAHVSMMLKGTAEQKFSHADLMELSGKDPATYLPLLADSYADRGAFPEADDAFTRYISTLPPEERQYYSDLSLIAAPETLREIEEAYPRTERQRLIRQFWTLADPTPTTPVNERRVEHYRRVYHARTHFAEGLDRLSLLGWDKRGDVYIRFGKPDHQSWSDFLVFETKPEVARVKNRINHLAHDALIEVIPPQHLHGGTVAGGGGGQLSADVRGIPTFPLPRRTTLMSDGVETGYEWESWIYGDVGGGIEITFIDEIGKGFYEFAKTPTGSPNRLLWQSLAPQTVVSRITSKKPSTYAFDYKGDPIDLFVSSATFQGEDGRSALEVYLGVPASQVSRAGGTVVDRELAVYNREWKLIDRIVDRLEHAAVDGSVSDDLVIDQVRTQLSPGDYFIAAQIRHPESGSIQIHKSPLTVPTHPMSGGTLGISELEVAAKVTVDGTAGKWQKGSLQVVPLPTHQVTARQPISLYYELYNLSRDTFGKTRYRVDYEVETTQGGLSVVSTLGRLIGRGPDDKTTQISYEHGGTSSNEQMYVSLSLPESSGSSARITVRVTDAQAAETVVTRSVELTVVDN